MSFDFLAALAVFAFVSSITPGPNNLMLMASGANFGFARTLPHMLGVSIGFVVMILLVGAGVVQIFERAPGSYLVLKFGSAAYLLWLAWKIATAKPWTGEAAAPDSRGKPFTFLQAALFQWVNPKAWTMALTAVSVYTIPANPMLSLGLVGLVFGLINAPSVSAWALMGVQMRRFLGTPARQRIFNVTAALLLVLSLYPLLTQPIGAHPP